MCSNVASALRPIFSGWCILLTYLEGFWTSNTLLSLPLGQFKALTGLHILNNYTRYVLEKKEVLFGILWTLDLP